jgi:hypothetical protein
MTMDGKYNKTVPFFPLIAAITAPASGAPATLTSLLNAAITAKLAGMTVLQVEIQEQGGLGVKVTDSQGLAGAGGWKIPANGEYPFVGATVTDNLKIESQTAGTSACVVIIYYSN